MTFSESDLDHIIQLAHLDVDAALRTQFLPQIQSILTHMESINQFDLSQVAPSATAFAAEMMLRDDVVVPQGDLLLSENAPVWRDSAFVVPRIN
jgi:aspartyl/glutamyl-tRNA(Asn/Gln) amidotransferase C subunit